MAGTIETARRHTRGGDRWAAAALGLGIATAYVAAAQLGFRFAVVAEQVTMVWAPSGIGLAVLLLWGRALWPAIWVGAFIANAGTSAPLWTAAAVATGNTLEAVTAVWLLRRGLPIDPRLPRVRDALALIVLGAGLSTMVSATIGVSTLCAAGVQAWARFGPLWWDWWLGDAVGILIVGPVLLTASGVVRWSRRELAETAVFLAGTVLVTAAVSTPVFADTALTPPLQYLVFPLVIGAAVRSSQPAVSLVVLGAAAVMIWNTAAGAGPFAGAPIRDSLILLQVFMGVLAGTAVLLSAATTERRTGERRRAAAATVGEILARAQSLAEAGPALMQAICERLGWEIGGLWLLDPADDRLHCVTIWTDARRPASAFASASRAMVFERGIGLPGRVLASGTAAWIENVTTDTNFPRAAVARATGVRSAFAIPIGLGEDVLGVVECFNRTILPPDEDLLQTMSSVGHQIGQFVGRKREEEARAEGDRERERLLEREAAARQDAEAANRAKDEFLATLSHELRTPLNAILGWSRMLLDGTMDDAGARRALDVIHRNAQLQAQLVGDILDVSRIITGGLRLEIQPLDLDAVIGAALDAVRPAAAARQVRLQPAPWSSRRVVHGDPQRLQQVVWNLLSNAVKFAEPGGTVRVSVVDTETGAVRISVEDDGVGIDPAFLPHVFERFRQADGSSGRQHGGLGLGLAIVRHLVELHGGQVRATSGGPGRGAIFMVELPVPSQQAIVRVLRPTPLRPSAPEPRRDPFAGQPPSPRRPAASRRRLRILVVDDNVDGADMLAAALTVRGYDTRIAHDGPSALHLAEGFTPHAALLDIGLPVMDGYELAARLRTLSGLEGIRLIAVTGYGQDADRARALGAGFDLHLLKPLDIDAVEDALSGLHASVVNSAG